MKPSSENQSALSATRLRQILHYDPLTGEFRWKVRHGRSAAGTRAGTLNTAKYWVISINCIRYRAHRLAWLYMTGEWPEFLIDHENGKGYDNRWTNLREATHAFNTQNKVKCASKVGLMGVTTNGRLFRAQITVKGRCRCIGSYKTAEEAHIAYLAAKKIHHPHAFVAQP